MPRTGDAGDNKSMLNVEDTLNTTIVDKPLPSVSHPSNKYPELDGSYILHKTIGSGGFSKVKMATDVLTGNKVAVKIVDKESLDMELSRIALEIKTLQPLKHPHICKLMGVIESRKLILMIMEYCPTDLYDFIRKQESYLSESEARRIFIQLMSAVAYLHANGIVHRDLKPENVLLDFNNNVKLTDFGLCAVPKKKEINKPLLMTLCGSPAYCAPELLKGPPYIGSKADVWSLGVILYVLLCGQLPFYSKNIRDLYKKIQDIQYVIPKWVADAPKDLIERILQENVNSRPSLNRLWSHPWIKESGLLDSYQNQISLAEKEIEEDEGLLFKNPEEYFIRNAPPKKKSKPTLVIGYMDSDHCNTIKNGLSNHGQTDVEENFLNYEEDLQLNNKRENKFFTNFKRIPKGFTRMKNTLAKYLNCFPTGTNNSSGTDKEPREIKWESLQNDKKMTGLTIVDEEFADCILDKLQLALQSMGIDNQRIGSTVKHGVTSPCKFKFEVVFLQQLDVFCIQRKYISSKDPKIIKNIIERVLLLSGRN